MLPHEQIFSIGSGRYMQAARRADGKWFVRFRRMRGPYVVWGKWEHAAPNRRPDHAWYNPNAGRARLPK